MKLRALTFCILLTLSCSTQDPIRIRQAWASNSNGPQQIIKGKKVQFFDNDAEEYDETLDRSRVLTKDTRINAILEDSINSQIPGRAIAIINRDVYSSDGNYILIPAHSKAVCYYENLEKQGQSNLTLKCTRIITPDGVSISLKNADAVRSGVGNGGAFIALSISDLPQAGSGMTRSRAVDQGVTNLSQNLAQVTSQFLEEAIDIKPVITIAAGTRIQIIPQHDIILKKPKIIKKRKRP